MENKLDIRNRYNELKKEFDELNEIYWSLDKNLVNDIEESKQFEWASEFVKNKRDLENRIREIWYLIKAMNKKLYYER